jgi:hypothetical protein
VLSACKTYLARDCASEGKGEGYLLGIVRGEQRRANLTVVVEAGVGQNGHVPAAPTMSPAIARALAEKQAEWAAESAR